MSERKRRHHYVTAGYLAMFSPERKRSGSLFLTDKAEGKVYSSSPSNAGLKYNYFTVDVPGMGADEIENLISTVEDKALPVFRKIERDRALPQGEEYDVVMWFLSLMVVRTPPFRSFVEGSTGQVLRRTLALTYTPERHREYEENVRRQGASDDEILTYERARELVDSDEIDILLRNEWFLSHMLRLSRPVFELLARRNWHVAYRTDNTSSRLVTSDRASILTWADEQIQGWPPGLALESTRLWFPVSDSTLLIGQFENIELKSSRLTNRIIRLHNSIQFHFAERFVFSGDSPFRVSPPSNESTNLLDVIVSERRRASHMM